jgi:hypothetical protein
MPIVMISVTWLLMTLTGLSGQTQANKKSVGSSGNVAVSDQDLNIRAYIELLRIDLRKQKALIMGRVMQLDADEAATFWPIYKEFEVELSRIGDQIFSLVKEYSVNYDKMTAPVADQLAIRLLTIEQQRNDLKRKYYMRVKGALDSLIAARFLQVENQLERLIDLQIAAELPVTKER